jgi:hypothetical protein
VAGIDWIDYRERIDIQRCSVCGKPTLRSYSWHDYSDPTDDFGARTLYPTDYTVADLPPGVAKRYADMLQMLDAPCPRDDRNIGGHGKRRAMRYWPLLLSVPRGSARRRQRHYRIRLARGVRIASQGLLPLVRSDSATRSERLLSRGSHRGPHQPGARLGGWGAAATDGGGQACLVRVAIDADPS